MNIFQGASGEVGQPGIQGEPGISVSGFHFTNSNLKLKYNAV